MATEEQFLNKIFDDAVSDNERSLAVKALKKITNLDRAGLVEKYTKTASSSSSSGELDYATRRISELMGENLKLTFENVDLRARLRDAEHQLEEAIKRHQRAIDMAHDAVEKCRGEVAKFEELVGQLALSLSTAGCLGIDTRVKLATDARKPGLSLLRWMIEGPVERVMAMIRAREHREHRQANAVKVQCAAPGCSNMFRPSRRGHKTCSDACRQALARSKAAIQSHASSLA